MPCKQQEFSLFFPIASGNEATKDNTKTSLRAQSVSPMSEGFCADSLACCLCVSHLASFTFRSRLCEIMLQAFPTFQIGEFIVKLTVIQKLILVIGLFLELWQLVFKNPWLPILIISLQVLKLLAKFTATFGLKGLTCTTYNTHSQPPSPDLHGAIEDSNGLIPKPHLNYKMGL